MQSCPGKSSLMGETQPGPGEQGLRGRPGPTVESSWRGETAIPKQASVPLKQNCVGTDSRAAHKVLLRTQREGEGCLLPGAAWGAARPGQSCTDLQV